jgi:hypothetical protein
MIRRRRHNKEIQFSFDSFLDVVANVVGIILRLILVAWVGARTYKGPPLPEMPPPPALAEPGSLPSPRDPLADELEQQRALLAQAQAHLLEHLQEWKDKRKEREALSGQVSSLAAQRQQLEGERQKLLAKAREDQNHVGQQIELSLAEFRQRSRKIIDDIEALKKKPVQKQALRYRTPVSQPLQTEEMQLECQRGRVTVLDVGGLVEEVRRVYRDKAELLKTRWEVSDVTPAVGAFRLRYVLEREREDTEAVLGSALPNRQGSFRCSLAWEAVPVREDRGETEEQALKPGSEFRRLLDNLDPNQTAVTFWVYPDSFPLYRKLRDYLHERDVVVAARPIMEGALIAANRRGTVSRGQ